MNKKIVLATLAFLIYGLAFSQNGGFEKGYFIDNKNNKVDCLIKNEDWDYNPTQFEYKTDANAKSNIMLVNNFQEFSVGGEYKFKKVSVKVDKSSDIFEDASGVKTLNYVEDILLLRIRVEGKAVLYSYQNENYTRFFYSLDEGTVTPLSYKLYYDDQEKNYRKNETYKQELLNTLKCDKISQRDVENLAYNSGSLSNFFTRYNICTGSSSVAIDVKKNIKTFEFYLKAGINVSRAVYDNGPDEFYFGNKAKFRPAVEAEINTSNKKKGFSILLELSYQYYKGSVEDKFTTIPIDYKAIDLSIGIRKYIYLNATSMLFINGYMIYGLEQDSKMYVYDNLKLTNSFSPSIGIGYLYNKKYTFDLRYDLNRNLLTNHTGQSLAYNSIGINVGYKLL